MPHDIVCVVKFELKQVCQTAAILVNWKPDKVKIWHWRACHDVVPFCAGLVTKGIDCSVTFPICEGNNESFLHFIKECPLLHSVVMVSS